MSAAPSNEIQAPVASGASAATARTKIPKIWIIGVALLLLIIIAAYLLYPKGATANQAYPGGGTYSQLAGQNLSMQQYSDIMENVLLNGTNKFNISYTENERLETGSVQQESGRYINIARYYNISRETATYPDSTTNITYIGSPNGDYWCYALFPSPFNCQQVSQKNIFNLTSPYLFLLTYVSMNTGELTLNGHFYNIAVSDSSYGGRPCRLISGDFYVSARNQTNSVTENGTMSQCMSTQYNVWLAQNLQGLAVLNLSGTVQDIRLTYSESVTSLNDKVADEIEQLPGSS